MNNTKKMLLSISIDPAQDMQAKIDYIKTLTQYNIDYIHCDIMDGVFVENMSYGVEGVQLINDNTIVPLDVHLMVVNPELYVKEFIKAGANILTVHAEAFATRKDTIKCLNKIKKLGGIAGLAFDITTDEKQIIDLLTYVDVLLVMGVKAGFSGQTFDEDAYRKIKVLTEIRTQFKMNFAIEVDGGVDAVVASHLKDLGVRMLVSGSFVYNSDNKELALKRLRG